MEEMLFEFVRRDRGARFAVTMVEESDATGHLVKKWRVECWGGKYSVSSHVTAPGLNDAIKSALKGVDFEPHEGDCRCEDITAEIYHENCPFHTWDDREEG
jgi:hypothetical protein